MPASAGIFFAFLPGFYAACIGSADFGFESKDIEQIYKDGNFNGLLLKQRLPIQKGIPSYILLGAALVQCADCANFWKGV